MERRREQEASKVAEKDRAVTHPIRLGLALNSCYSFITNGATQGKGSGSRICDRTRNGVKYNCGKAACANCLVTGMDAPMCRPCVAFATEDENEAEDPHGTAADAMVDDDFELQGADID